MAQRDTPRPLRPLRRRRGALSANTTTLKSSEPPRRARSRRPGSGGGQRQRQTRSRTRCPYRCTRHGGGHVSTLTVDATARAQMARPRRAWQQVGHPYLCGVDGHVTSQSCCARPGHLRVCGEQRLSKPESPEPSGSSLRVRGTDSAMPNYPLELWVIPACAGNGEARWCARCVLPGHPCVYGEQATATRRLPVSIGSSLRVRGTAEHLAN